MTSCRTETETGSQMEKAGPFDCCSHQSVASPSLCLCQGSTVDIFSTFCGVFTVQCVKFNAENFWIWCFAVWLFCLLPKCNLSETFYEVWALHWWVVRWKT